MVSKTSRWNYQRHPTRGGSSGSQDVQGQSGQHKTHLQSSKRADLLREVLQNQFLSLQSIDRIIEEYIVEHKIPKQKVRDGNNSESSDKDHEPIEKHRRLDESNFPWFE